ncbi:MAG: putative lipid II flippase FtsW [Elusimicrobia bacterium]|nr:putative lipid II flippase FtsW [Elusimicrobiota bacterium]
MTKDKVYLLKPVKAPKKNTEAPPKTRFLMPDRNLLIIMFTLMLFGLVFTYSSSAFESGALFKRQLIFGGLGLIAAAFLSQYYLRLQKKINPMFILYGAWFLLVFVLFTPKVANVHRWINLGFFNLQPSEVAKPALIIYIAYYLDNISASISKSFNVIVPPLVLTAVTLGLMMLAPELGTPALLFAVVFLMLYTAGARLKHLLLILACAIPVALHQMIFYSYRMKRLFSFLSPETASDSSGYQLFQSFLAIGSGGWFGKGLGNSELKLQYLPAAHTDFIFAIIAEEAGMFGALIIVALFAWMLIRGIKVARRAKNTFNSMLALGITLTITLQAFLNMGVAVGLLPTKGLPLPFFSYGGSSVLVTMAMMGILFNISAVEKANLKERV